MKNCICEFDASAASKDNNPEVKNEITLDKLPRGKRARLVKVSASLSVEKKFLSIGLIEGNEVLMQGRAPLGSLVRIKVLDSSVAFPAELAKNVIVRIY